MIVFVSNCDSVDFHQAILGQALTLSEDKKSEAGPLIPIPIHKLHGNMPQLDRTKVYGEFNKSKNGVLICTDVGECEKPD